MGVDGVLQSNKEAPLLPEMGLTIYKVSRLKLRLICHTINNKAVVFNICGHFWCLKERQFVQKQNRLIFGAHINLFFTFGLILGPF